MSGSDQWYFYFREKPSEAAHTGKRGAVTLTRSHPTTRVTSPCCSPPHDTPPLLSTWPVSILSLQCGKALYCCSSADFLFLKKIKENADFLFLKKKKKCGLSLCKDDWGGNWRRSEIQYPFFCSKVPAPLRYCTFALDLNSSIPLGTRPAACWHVGLYPLLNTPNTEKNKLKKKKKSYTVH